MTGYLESRRWARTVLKQYLPSCGGFQKFIYKKRLTKAKRKDPDADLIPSYAYARKSDLNKTQFNSYFSTILFALKSQDVSSSIEISESFYNRVEAIGLANKSVVQPKEDDYKSPLELQMPVHAKSVDPA